MNLKFILEDNTNIIYDSSTNQLLKNNIPFEINDERNYNNINNNISMRLFLGDQCNFSCKYCFQKYLKSDSESKANISDFCINIRNFLGERKLYSLSFWGGEPFVYFDYIKEICNQLKDKINMFSITTNGSFLGNKNIFNWIKNNIDAIETIVVSYDGPGQSLRGPDILDNVNIRNSINYLISQNKLYFNCVITNKNNNINKYFEHIQNKLELDNINNLKVNFSPVFVQCNDSLLDYSLTETQLIEFYKDLYNSLFDDNKYKYQKLYMFDNNLLPLINILNKTELTNRCLVGSTDHLSCDIDGNILICHNNPDKNNNYLGHISELKPNSNIPIPGKIKVIENWNTICKTCIVKYLCNGGCSMSSNKYKEENCLGHKYLFIFYLTTMVTLFTSQKVKEIQFI